MLQGEHSAILSTFIKLAFVIKIIFLSSIFEWRLKTGFAVTENGILSVSFCMHMRILVHVGTPLFFIVLLLKNLDVFKLYLVKSKCSTESLNMKLI